MDKSVSPSTRKARWAIMGRLLESDIHPSVCRAFEPDRLDATTHHLTIAHAALAGTIFPPSLAQLVGHTAWKPTKVLETCILHVLERFPDADPRSHLAGGFVMMAMLPFWTPMVRVQLCAEIEYVLDMSRNDEVAGSRPDMSQDLLGAYDAALAMAVAGSSTTMKAADGEGADED